MGKITKIKLTLEQNNETEESLTERKYTTTKPPKNVNELRKILEFCYKISPVLSYTFELQAVSGLRYSDASQIEYEDLYDNKGGFKEELSVIQIKKFNILKNKKNLSAAIREATIHVPITENIKRIIEEVSTFTGGHQFVFSNKRTSQTKNIKQGYAPTGIRSANRLLNKTKAALNLKYNLNTHSFRKYFANNLLINGADMVVIRDMLGHSSISSTNSYLDTFSSDITRYASKIKV